MLFIMDKKKKQINNFGKNSIFQEGKYFRGFLLSSANPHKEKFAVKDSY